MPRRKPIDRLRAICMALPDVTEKEAWGEPTFRVGGKMFVMFSNNHHDDGRIAAWCSATFETQDLLARSQPERFFVLPYQGARGWIGVRLEPDRVDRAQGGGGRRGRLSDSRSEKSAETSRQESIA